MQKLLSIFNKYQWPLLFSASFGIWVYCFRGFIFGYEAFTSDALAYQYSTKFFIENISQGVYPLWDPLVHSVGAPFEFFHRRMGSYNPIYLFLLVIYKAGLSFHRSYHVYLAVYFFLGMLSFFGIARILLKDDLKAFMAFLLLYFSSWSTRLYDSYIHLTFIPLLFFLYFVLAFFNSPSRKNFLGGCFALMILFITYLPFYFLMVVFLVFLMSLIFYPLKMTANLKALAGFCTVNKIFTGFCVLMVLVSLLPGINFFIEGRGGSEVVLGHRSAEVLENKKPAEAHIIEVGFNTITSWGIEEDLMYSFAYSDMRFMKFAVVYLPVFGVCVFLIGLLAKVRKLTCLLIALMFVVLLMFTHRLPVYELLFNNIFFFKYFRNLHFFLWFALLPIFCLLIPAQFFSIKKPINSGKLLHRKILLTAVIGTISCGYFIFLKNQGGVIYADILTILLGSVCLTVMVWMNIKYRAALWVLLLLMTLSPVQVYSNLADNLKGELKLEYLTGFEKSHQNYKQLLQNYWDQKVWIKNLQSKDPKPKFSRFHYALSRHAKLTEKINADLVWEYGMNRIYAYDAVRRVDKPEEISKEQLIDVFYKLDNIAYVEGGSNDVFNGLGPIPSSGEYLLNNTTKDLEILDSNVNSLLLKTAFDKNKFILFADGYHSGWKAKVDGRPVKLYPANYVFKGVFVPAGEHIVRFNFGSWWLYVFNYSMMAIFYGCFIWLIFLILKEKGRKVDVSCS